MNRMVPAPRFPDPASLFAVEREILPEPEEVRQRVLKRVRSSMPRILPVRRAMPEATRARRAPVGRVALAALVVSGLCSAAFYAGYRSGDAAVPDPTPSAVEAPATAPARGKMAPVSDTSVTASPPDEPDDPAKPAAAAEARPQPARSTSGRTATRSEDVEAYAMELRVLQPAQRALARKDYRAALAAVAEHQRRFPSGTLSEEREALRVKALLGLGREKDAHQAGAAFRKRFPESALGGRMDEMLEPQR